jgi:hypothetical protein
VRLGRAGSGDGGGGCGTAGDIVPRDRTPIPDCAVPGDNVRAGRLRERATPATAREGRDGGGGGGGCDGTAAGAGAEADAAAGAAALAADAIAIG